MMPRISPYVEGLEKTAANHVPLTPLSFLERAARVYPGQTSVIHGARSYSWAQTRERCHRLASALAQAGVGPGDTVAMVAANTPEAIEAHFGVPLAGAVLNMLNTRLDAAMLAYMLRHGEAKVLLTDTEFSPTVGEALKRLEAPPLVIDIDDLEGPGGARLGTMDYEAFLAGGDPQLPGRTPEDEWSPIALNYTSGTTSNPKGVVYHHRGAYIAAISNMIDWGMSKHCVMLWTLPLFHCNGWCLAWSVAANAGTHICLRRVTPERILALITAHQVTHFGGAPVVHAMIAQAMSDQALSHQATIAPTTKAEGAGPRVAALVGGAPAPVQLIEEMERKGFSVTQIYGLTEVYGPAAICAEQPAWAGLDTGARAALRGRQGVRYTGQEHMEVLDPASMAPVPADGSTLGEVMFRGNMTMMGYLKNRTATDEAFAGGWFHSGDLAVVWPDGYFQIRDRVKDVIISGGENINSLEVEEALYRHPAVRSAAVVAGPDPKWGETPFAFVELKDGSTVTEQDLIAHCLGCIARFKCPKRVIIAHLPKTETGKIKKFMLRDVARALQSTRGNIGSR